MKVYKEGKKGSFDAVVFLALKTHESAANGCIGKYQKFIDETKLHDENLDKEGGFILLPEDMPIRRLIYSPVGPINRDQDDVRRFRDAAFRGVKRALKSGALQPLIVMPSFTGAAASNYSLYDVVTVLGSYEAIYTVKRQNL